MFKTSATDGQSEDDIAALREYYGLNRLKTLKKVND